MRSAPARSERGADEAGQVISYTVTAVPPASQGSIVLADGTTAVSAASSYSLAQLQGMQFRSAANANGGPYTFSWRVNDTGSSANGGINTLIESLAITVTAKSVVGSTPTPVAVPTAADPASLPATAQTSPVAASASTTPLTTAVRGSVARSDLATEAGAAEAQSDVGGGDGSTTFVRRLERDLLGSTIVELTPVSFVSAERRAAILAPQLIVEPEFAPFNLQVGGVSLSPQEAERSLRSPVFLEQMDRMREDLRKELNLDSTVAISVAGASLGGSVIYLLWMIRGGVLMGSYLSALPAWQVLDPLPVLERLKDPTQDDDELPDDLSDLADDGLQSLRGY